MMFLWMELPMLSLSTHGRRQRDTEERYIEFFVVFDAINFYKPWLGDKVWRVKVSVQGNELVLWLNHHATSTKVCELQDNGVQQTNRSQGRRTTTD